MIANITARPNASLLWKSPTFLPRPKTHLILTSALCRLSFMKTLQEVAQQAMICVPPHLGQSCRLRRRPGQIRHADALSLAAPMTVKCLAAALLLGAARLAVVAVDTFTWRLVRVVKQKRPLHHDYFFVDVLIDACMILILVLRFQSIEVTTLHNFSRRRGHDICSYRPQVASFSKEKFPAIATSRLAPVNDVML